VEVFDLLLISVELLLGGFGHSVGFQLFAPARVFSPLPLFPLLYLKN
jgi:hypothetical protein